MKNCWRATALTRGCTICNFKKSSRKCRPDPCRMSAPRMTAAPLKSMTGYAQAREEKNGWAEQLSLRSVNHRFLDMRVRLPDGWESLETEIRKGGQERFRRGHV